MAARKPEIAITLLVSRVCAVALYALCYGRWSLRIGNGHFRNLTEQKPPNRSKQKCAQLITSVGSPCRPKFIMIGGGSRFPIWVKLSTGGVFSGVLFSKRTADPKRLSPIYYTSIDAVSAKDVPLGSHRYISSHGELSPKTPHFGVFNGDFQHKGLRAYLGKEETYHDALRLKMRIP